MSSRSNSQKSQDDLKSLKSKELLPSKILKSQKRIPYIDLSIPGTPVSSRYVIAWKAQQEREKLEGLRYSPLSQTSVDATISNSLKENARESTPIAPTSNSEKTTFTSSNLKQNEVEENQAPLSEPPNHLHKNHQTKLNVDPFKAFLDSMDKLKSDRLRNVDSKDILDLFLKLENAARAKEEIDDVIDDDGYRSIVSEPTYGHAYAGKYNTGSTSNLNVFSLSFLHRRNSNQDIGGSYFYSPTLFTEYRRKSREITRNDDDGSTGINTFPSLRRSVSNLEQNKQLKEKYRREK